MAKGEKKLFDRFIKFISTKDLINQEEKILVTVSGGLDSSVMTHLFSQSGFNFGIAHCNFSLRGKESERDAKFVEKLALEYGRPFHLEHFETKKFAAENKYSIQEAARILRYKWFNRLSAEFNYDKIATAHQLDDSIETFFINLLRGTGTAGLRGIPVKNKTIIRPLLFARRKEIKEYADLNKIDYREDSSNDSDDYLRNRIRHHVIPALRQSSDGFEEHMIKLMEEFNLVDKLVNEKMDEWKLKNVSTGRDGNILIPLERILNREYPSSFLSLLLHSYGVRSIDPRQVLSSETPGKIFHGREYTLLRDRENLILGKKIAVKEVNYVVSSVPAEINTGNSIISIHSVDNKKTGYISDSKNIQTIDGDKISFPMTLRPWKPGDYFYPLGMKGKKKISDFYTDQKINRFEKDNTLLLLSGTDIVCILGHRIDDRFKITTSTTRVLIIELTPK